MIKKSQEHLNSLNENYAEDISVAFKVSSKMIIIGFKTLIHGLIPAIFERKVNNGVEELYNLVNQKR